ncbi:MAG: hypothetical protein LBS85_01535 [Clostridiales Family XIII bacterium]|jgi:Tfp pilus assembly protein PilX|nr:hypothetical protein [Clostridiales Family XIII bacterium]
MFGEFFKKRFRARSGSVLIWTLVSMFVLTILISAVFYITTVSHQQTGVSQAKTQAYYTAESLNECIADWISEEKQPSFKTELKDGAVVMDYSEADLGAKMGSAKTMVEYADENCSVIRITTTAMYGGCKETIVTTMNSHSIKHEHGVQVELAVS